MKILEWIVFFINSKYFVYAQVFLFSAGFLFLLFKVYMNIRRILIEKLQYKRYFDTDTAAVGEELHLIQEVINNSIFPIFFVQLVFYMSEGISIDGNLISVGDTDKPVISYYHLMPKSIQKRVHKIRGVYRKHHKINYAYFKSSGDNIFIEAPAELYIYPKKLDNYEVTASLQNESSRIVTSSKRTDPFFTSGVRAYQFGDPLRSINHKASSRSLSYGRHSLMVNNYDSSVNNNIMIYLNLGHHSSKDSKIDFLGAFEYALELSTFLLMGAVESGGAVGFCTNVGTEPGKSYLYFPCEKGIAHASEILRALSSLEYESSPKVLINSLVDEYCKNTNGEPDVFVISIDYDERISRAVQVLKSYQKEVQLISLLEMFS